MLLASYLRDRPSHALAHTIRELRSASNQFGKERALCELYGAGGWDSTFEDYKRMADWVLVGGVNFIDQHLTYATLMGARKYDHPQSFDWREPWWDEYTAMNDYIGRAQWMLTRGRMEQRILVLNPSTTGFLESGPEAAGDMFGNGGPDCIKKPDMTGFLTLCQTLTDRQWDYDLGDEYTLARHGRAADGRLTVEKQRYSVVVVSGDMKNMLASTVGLLKAAVRAGVTVFAVGTPGCYVNGEEDAAAYAELASLWQRVTVGEIDARLGERLPRRITADRDFPEGFDHMRRALDDGSTVWFLVNHAMEPFDAALSLPGGGVRSLDLYTGEVKPIPHTAASGRVRIPVSLVRNQSLLLLVTEAAAEPAPARETPDADVPLSLCGVTRQCENTFPIAYCDYRSAWGEATEHYYINLKDAPYLDFSQPWWQGEAMDSLQVGEDRLFFLSGEILLSNILHIGAIYFNKDIFDAHFGDSRNLYQLVLDGGWTYDRFAEYSEQVYTDVNGNGIKDGEDVFGFYADLGSSIDHFTFASDVELSRRGEDGLPELTILSDRLVQLTEVLYKLYYENAGVMVDNDEGRHHELFAGGYTLFHPFRLVAGTLPALREMESDYGIIPYPKLDAEQKEYRTLIHNASSIVFVPITCRKVATVCAVLEALAAESHRSVTEVGYETLLKRKYSRDDVSSQMIDLIYAAARKDFAYNYAASLSNAGFITREVIAARSADIASYYAKREKAYTLTLNKLIEFYTGG